MKNSKNKLLVLIFTMGLFLFSFNTYAQSNETIKGEVLDLSCYMSHGAKGQGHKKCAEGCILKKKLPAGILSQDGQVYLLVEDHDASKAYEKVLHHAAETVKITGKVVKKNGVQSLVVEKVTVES